MGTVGLIRGIMKADNISMHGSISQGLGMQQVTIGALLRESCIAIPVHLASCT